MTDQLKSAIINAADKEYSSFKDNVGGILTDKLQTVLSRVVDQKEKTMFKKDGV